MNISLRSRTLQGESAGQFRRLDGPHVELRVRDTGEGISAEAKSRLFDPFFTTRKQGTGIGLSVVHGIVEELKGRIEVESEPGQGSCFVVTLPTTESPSIAKIEGGGHRVLLAEDDPILRSALCEMLVFSGYDVTAAADGQEALVQLETCPAEFDVIITDQRMPRMTGVELIKAARRLRTDIPVLLMTGYTDQDSTLLKPPFIQRLLHKPFKAAGLHDQIQIVLKERADCVATMRGD